MPTMTTTILLLFFLSAVAAQSPAEPASAPVSGEVASAPGPGSADCTTYLYNMVDCLSYVEAGSNTTVPEKPCCGELAALIKDHPVCLCELLSNSTDSIGIEIDVHRAMKLQTVCKVDAPPISLCSVAGYPVAGVPSYSPMSPGMSPEGVVAPSNSETEKGENGANSGLSQPSVFLVCFAIALFSSTFFSS